MLTQSLPQNTGIGTLFARQLGEAPTADNVPDCEDGNAFICEQVYDLTANETAANWAGVFLDRSLHILLILAIALMATWFVRRAIRKTVSGVTGNQLAMKMAAARDAERSAQIHERTKQRSETITHVLDSISAAIIWSIALLLVLGELGINLGPLIAGAGIAGIALGFGAQSLVQDFIAGIFMVSEDQFGVGDIVDLGEATGTVERVTLRTTVLRDIYGTVWHVPNGQVQRVGNKSQLWAVALVDVGIAYGADVDAASDILSAAAHTLAEDDEYSTMILEEPRVLGVQALDADAVTLRMSIKTQPAAQFAVQRELNRRIKEALDAAGIEIPYPQRTVWMRDDKPSQNTGAEGETAPETEEGSSDA